MAAILPLALLSMLVGACGVSPSDSTPALRHGAQGYLLASPGGVIWIQLEHQVGDRVSGTSDEVTRHWVPTAQGQQLVAADWSYQLSGKADGDTVTLKTGPSLDGGPPMGSFGPMRLSGKGLFQPGTGYTYRNANAAEQASAVGAAKACWTSEDPREGHA
jgi:hypothetical protein